MIVDFNDLPAAVRRRFLAAIQPRTPGDPSPRLLIASERKVEVSPSRYGVIAALMLVIVALIVFSGYMIVRREPQYGLVAGAAALLVAGAVGLMARWVARAAWHRRPYVQGRYLFASYLVRARETSLELTPCSELGPVVVVKWKGRPKPDQAVIQDFELILGNTAQESAERFNSMRETFHRARQAGDGATVAQLDPFVECSMGLPWRSPQADADVPSRIVLPPRWFLPAGLVATLVFAAATYGTIATFGSEFAEERRAEMRAYEASQEAMMQRMLRPAGQAPTRPATNALGTRAPVAAADPFESLGPRDAQGMHVCSRGSFELRGGTFELSGPVLKVEGSCRLTLEGFVLRSYASQAMVTVTGGGRLTLKGVELRNRSGFAALEVNERGRVTVEGGAIASDSVSVYVVERARLSVRDTRFTGRVIRRGRASVDDREGNVGFTVSEM